MGVGVGGTGVGVFSAVVTSGAYALYFRFEGPVAAMPAAAPSIPRTPTANRTSTSHRIPTTPLLHAHTPLRARLINGPNTALWQVVPLRNAREPHTM
jgi:hypothetical protein